MSEDRVTDAKRIGQLLASEVTGIDRGGLRRLAVVDADRDAEASPDGTVAYRLAVEGDPVAAVVLYDDAAVIEFDDGGTVADSPLPEDPDRADLTMRTTDGQRSIRIESGAAVKRAADVLSALFA